MRKIISTILVFYLFSGCQYIEEKPIENESIKKKYAPLFLSLSNKMTQAEFNDEIANLNSLGKLNEGKFHVSTKKQNLYFNIDKRRSSIRLRYGDMGYKSLSNISYELSQEYINESYDKVFDIINIYESNYKGKEITLPTNIKLTDYGLNKTYYKVFQNSSKTVLFGYDIDEVLLPSLEELEEERINSSFLDNMARFSNLEEKRKLTTFGHIMLIDYFYKEDFDKLLAKMKSDSIINIKKNADLIEKRIRMSKKIEEDKAKNLKEL